MRILSVRETPEIVDNAIAYFQGSWPDVLPIIYEDCIRNSIKARNTLPQWYILEKEETFIGCGGLITNDFISRGDLYPWVCSVFIEETHRGNAYGSLILEKAKADTKKFGFDSLYLSTQHIGLYEKYGFRYIGQGYHPWGDTSRIYEFQL
jgi:N-acetylglutamate synthase-like GNAT family acetyltransferase